MSMFSGSSRRQKEHALMRLVYDRQGKGQAMREIHGAWLEWRSGRGPDAQGTLEGFLERMLRAHPQIRNAGSIKNAIRKWRAELDGPGVPPH